MRFAYKQTIGLLFFAFVTLSVCQESVAESTLNASNCGIASGNSANNNTLNCYEATVQVIINSTNGGDNTSLRDNQARVAELAKQIGVTSALIGFFLQTLGENPAQDNWPKALADIALRYHAFEQSAQLVNGDNPDVKALVDKARDAASQARFDDVSELLLEASNLTDIDEHRLEYALHKVKENKLNLIVAMANNELARQHLEAGGKLLDEAIKLAQELGLADFAENLHYQAQDVGFAEYKCGAVGSLTCIWRW